MDKCINDIRWKYEESKKYRKGIFGLVKLEQRGGREIA